MTVIADKPKYIQLAEQLKERIHAGELKAGDRLPSYSEMYREFGATTSTVQRVCHLLEEENLIERRNGSGIYVTGSQRRVLTGNIGLIASLNYYKAQQTPFFAHNAGGIQDAALRYKKRLLLLATDRDWDPSCFSQVDGMLLSGHRHEINQAILHAKPSYMPCVSMFIVAEGMNSVVVDDYGAAKIAMRHLLELGHQRISCLMMDIKQTPQIPSSRVAGYQDALREAEIISDPRWLRRLHRPELNRPESVTHQSLLEWGRQEMQQWLKTGWRKLDCTAILVQNDHIAIGVMQVLQEANIDVPGEVSVMGFDGTELCDHTTPRLSSVQLPLEQIGSRAVDLIVEQIENGQPEEQIIILPAKLRAGASTAPVKI